ncbi:MerR family transcriptional regulator [Nakamurella sp. YIM 132087]|uniref:MerR family transcriptional regulator n=1 Tax=Nakamurella alba TaxID=2665158 RepID=A0A7K1FV18_9ACTN|nr:MerR family transcriptional regulator [Nakamurella alba]MTD17043.1 MerR family transcriptional regulator [Nakamurella alba]
MRIGELAGRAGVSVRSLRYYEEQGLLTSARSSGGQRTYGDEDLERVTFIQNLYAAGLSSRTIAAVLPCVDAPSDANTELAWHRLVQEREGLDTRIDELVRTRVLLDRVIEANRRHLDGQVCDPA